MCAAAHVPWVTRRGSLPAPAAPTAPALLPLGARLCAVPAGQRRAAGTGFLSVKQKTAFALRLCRQSCVPVDFTYRGIISPGGIGEPEKPDIARLSLTKDEK